MRLEEISVGWEIRGKQSPRKVDLSERAHADWCAEYDRINPIVDRISAEDLLAEIRALRE